MLVFNDKLVRIIFTIQSCNEGVFNLGPVKTLKSVRTIDIPEVLWQHLDAKYTDYNDVKETDAYRNTEIVLDKTKKGVVTKIIGGDFINRKENGELLTINSIKYWSKTIKAETAIDFKFHSLRKTHATMMANANTPALELMNRLGHRKYDTTLSYYVNNNLLAREQLKFNINGIEELMCKSRQQLVEAKEREARLPDFRKDVLSAIQTFEDESAPQQL